MKDLYTFDATKEAALHAYETARHAYSAFFQDLKLPILSAAASSGSIGGDLSHEYHLPSQKGEDNIMRCNTCEYVANEEVATRRAPSAMKGQTRPKIFAYDTGHFRMLKPETLVLSRLKDDWDVQVWTGVSIDRQTIYQAIIPLHTRSNSTDHLRPAKVNLHALKNVFEDVDFSIGQSESNSLGLPVEEAMQLVKDSHSNGSNSRGDIERLFRWRQVYDYQIPLNTVEEMTVQYVSQSGLRKIEEPPSKSSCVDLVKLEDGDGCPACAFGTLTTVKAIELGHTFYLGTKYSEPLGARIANEKSANTTPMEMGCHGIGISRLIGAVADSLADEKGLNWPRAVAPFEAVVIAAPGNEEDAVNVLDILATHDSATKYGAVDAIIDDRDKRLIWKLHDADLIGYPVIILLGRAWASSRSCEVQCRRLKVKEDVPVEKLREFVESLLVSL